MSKGRTFTAAEADAHIMAAVKAGNKRALMILASPEAKGREELARFMAFQVREEDLPAEAAIECLKLSGRD
jgi:hypothetical protein